MWKQFRKLTLGNQLYLSLGLLCLLLAFIPMDPVDITSHDTYFVIDTFFIWNLIGVFYLFYFGINVLLVKIRKPVRQFVLWIHLCLSTSSIILTTYYLLIDSSITQYTDYSVYDEFDSYEYMTDMNFHITCSFFVFCLAQFIIIAGMIIALIRQKKSA